MTPPTTQESQSETYYGKYRATVVNNVDPMMLGRIQVIVPDVTGMMPTTWAMPCMPVAGPQVGLLGVPPVGAGVWVEFERGDPEHPIWVGAYWTQPAEATALAKMVPPGTSGLAYQTQGQTGIVVTDLPGPTGGVLLKSAGGASISVSADGITIQDGMGGSILMKAGKVIVNGGALTVL